MCLITEPPSNVPCVRSDLTVGRLAHLSSASLSSSRSALLTPKLPPLRDTPACITACSVCAATLQNAFVKSRQEQNRVRNRDRGRGRGRGRARGRDRNRVKDRERGKWQEPG